MPGAKTDLEQFKGILGQFDADTIVAGVREHGVNCPVFLATNDCEGRRIAVDNLKKGLYLSDYFFTDDAAKKADVISAFLSKFTTIEPCTGGCNPSTGLVCRPKELRFVATEGSADMTLMEGKLFGKDVRQYVLRANLDSKGDFTTMCDCMPPAV